MENEPSPDNIARLEQATDPKTALLDLEVQVDEWIEQAKTDPSPNVMYEHGRLDDGSRMEAAKYGNTLTVHRSIPENMGNPTHFFITYYAADREGVTTNQLVWNSVDRELHMLSNVHLQGTNAIKAARMAAQLHSLFSPEEDSRILGTGMSVEFWMSQRGKADAVRSDVTVTPERTANETEAVEANANDQPVTRRGLFGWLGKLGTQGSKEK